MDFEFATAQRIIFHPGSLAKIGEIVAGLGQRALVVTHFSVDDSLLQRLCYLLDEAGLERVIFSILGEPTVTSIQNGLDLAKNERCDLVIGFGGGSSIDSGKAVAALVSNQGNVLDYLEVIGRGRLLINAPLPYIAIPTTAGTGAEVTRNAVIGSPDHHIKVSLRSPLMIPKFALIDPELTYSLPPEVTAYTGVDALAQLIEPFVCKAPNPLVDAFCRDGIPRAAIALPRCFHHPDDHQARADMSLASLLSGLALANAKLGAVHGFAGPIGGMCFAPHGAICARLLPIVVKMNLSALLVRSQDNPALERYREIACLITGDDRARFQDLVDWLYHLRADLRIPSLSEYGLEQADLGVLIASARQSSSMKGNPIMLLDEELKEIIHEAL